jgi:hypothetical protein
VLLLYCLAIAADALIFLRGNLHALGWIAYFVTLLLLTAALIAICYKTGEKPGWRWG